MTTGRDKRSESRQASGRVGGDGEPDDRSLVVAFQRDPDGEAGRRAVSLLLDRYRRRVLVWCWQVVRNRETALDLAQEVLVSAYRNLCGYEEQDHFDSWLFAIARNRCLSELRRRQVPVAEAAVLELVADPGPGPDVRFERELEAQELQRLVRETLTPLEQEALRLRCYEGLPVETITRRLELREASGARAVLQRARRKLRAALAGAPAPEDGEGDSS